MTRSTRWLTSTALCLTMAVSGGLAQIGPAYAESNGGVKIMPLGDSITDGASVPGGYRTELWKKLVAGKYTVDFVGSMSNGPAGLGDHDHEGHSGWTISQIDAKVVNWLKAYQPRTILLHIGTNDMNFGAANAPTALGTLLDHITTQAPDAEVFVATIIPNSIKPQDVQTYNSKIPNVVKTRADAGKHVQLVDMYSKLTTSDLAEGVHPNAGGYAKMAAAWYDALLNVPASLTRTGTSAAPTTSTSSPGHS